MGQLSKYREVWVAEDSDGRPLRSAINIKRLNDQSNVFRYVPAELLKSALGYLDIGKIEQAMHVLRSAIGD